MHEGGWRGDHAFMLLTGVVHVRHVQVCTSTGGARHLSQHGGVCIRVVANLEDDPAHVAMGEPWVGEGTAECAGVGFRHANVAIRQDGDDQRHGVVTETAGSSEQLFGGHVESRVSIRWRPANGKLLHCAQHVRQAVVVPREIKHKRRLVAVGNRGDLDSVAGHKILGTQSFDGVGHDVLRAAPCHF